MRLWYTPVILHLKMETEGLGATGLSQFIKNLRSVWARWDPVSKVFLKKSEDHLGERYAFIAKKLKFIWKIDWQDNLKVFHHFTREIIYLNLWGQAMLLCDLDCLLNKKEQMQQALFITICNKEKQIISSFLIFPFKFGRDLKNKINLEPDTFQCSFFVNVSKIARNPRLRSHYPTLSWYPLQQAGSSCSSTAEHSSKMMAIFTFIYQLCMCVHAYV